MMRMMRFLKHNELFVHLTKYTAGIGVLEQIFKRLDRLVGARMAHRIAWRIQFRRWNAATKLPIHCTTFDGPI
ncbi:MAG: hypothetical protein MZU97_05030 [Bacillus subtilis]|nr:hypothetical protein [Bacillus subtilis]